MAIQPDVYVSPQAYLALERQAAYKSEYIAGTVVAMSGASREHNLIVINTAPLPYKRSMIEYCVPEMSSWCTYYPDHATS
jgi:hypothetical protein